MKKLHFTKMHGIWNDFIIVNKCELEEKNIDLNHEFIKKICHRNFGIWSDWLLLVCKWTKADYKYIMYNPDGSEAEMCWNWIRCYMKYLKDNNIIDKSDIDIETWVWILNLNIMDDVVTVDMWNPSKINNLLYESKKLWDRFPLKIENTEFIFTPVSMWNPHAVIFLRDINISWITISDMDLKKIWSLIENRVDIFPEKVNVEFAYVKSIKEIDMRVWERWAWETLACWTWACATVVAWILGWRLEKNVFIKVNLKWGILEIKWSWNIKDPVIMKWGAEIVFEWVYIIK